MDPCPFVRLNVDSLALKLAAATRPSGSGIHPSATPCYAKLKIKNFPSQTALLPLISGAAASPPDSSSAATCFDLDPDALRALSCRPVLALKIKVFSGRMGRTCGVTSGKLLGSLQLTVNLAHAQARACVYHNGWMKLGGGGDPAARLHVTVRSEPDPRFVFQFGGEPECSPVVFQIQGNIRQPVFSCKFTADRSNRSRYAPHPRRTFRDESANVGRALWDPVSLPASLAMI